MDEITKKNLTGIERLLYIMARLRDPDGGCPWDIEQDFSTIVPYTIEEAYEVADAIEHQDMTALKDELGDLLLQVVFHSQMAEENEEFNFQVVVDGISEKMIRRHPHVFGSEQMASVDQQRIAWEDQKAREREEKSDASLSALSGVAKGMPALLRSFKLQKRAARVGFDWPDPQSTMDKLGEEIIELQDEIIAEDLDRDKLIDELGDVLFCVVNVARKLDIDPEAALRHGNAKFEDRFGKMEQFLSEEGKNISQLNLGEMEVLWKKAKGQS